MRPLSVAILALFAALAATARVAPAPSGVSVADWSQIRAEYGRFKHSAFPDGDGFRARTRELRWNTLFSGRGFEIRPDDAAWTFGLELTGHRDARVAVNRNRVQYAWGSNLEEWFVNEAKGLEHGFTIRHKRGPIDLRLAVRGTLRAEGSGVALRFVDKTGRTILTYSGLKAWDADGRDLLSHMEASHGTVRLTVDDRGARYPVTIDPIVQQAYLKPGAVGSSQVDDYFGHAVAVSGDTVVVGAYFENSATTGVNTVPNEAAPGAGAVYVFVRSGSTWTQQAYLKPAAVGTSQANDFFGDSVAISGDTIVVGATGEDSSTTGINSTPNELAPYSGAAYIFVRSAGAWTQQAYLKPANIGTSQTDDNFGVAVAISGDTVVVGANQEDSSTTGVGAMADEGASNAGAAYVFVRNGTSWAQQSFLKPAAVGTVQAGDGFGRSVSLSGDTIAVGAPQEDSSTLGVNSTANESSSGSGAVYVFVRNTGTWTQQAYLKPASVGTTQAGDGFGTSVSISGGTLIAGAPSEGSSTLGVNSTPNESGFGSGAAYVFVRSGSSWTQQAYLKPAAVGTRQNSDAFGSAVAVSGDMAVVGAFGEDSSTLGVDSIPDEAAAGAGAVYVFARASAAWSQIGYLKPLDVGTSQVGDFLGSAVAVAGDTIVAGAVLEKSFSQGINSTPNEARSSGAAYIWFRSGPAITEVIDAGSLRPEIAGSSWVTIKGTLLAPLTRIWVDSDFIQGRLPTALNGVSVTIDGKPAYVYYISPTQINVLAPALTRTGSVPVTVTTSEGTATSTAAVAVRVPSWFLLDPENRKYVAAVNLDGSIVGKAGLYPSAPNATKPLPRGGRALIYGTSWGPTTTPTPEGTVFSSAYPIAGASIRIGGQNVVIEFAGVVTPGLFQFNIIAPNLQPGDYLIEGTINGVSTQPSAYITLGP